MNQKSKPGRRAAPGAARAGDLRFGRWNYAVLGSALGSILIGFFLLAQGSITAAPILLVLGYCVLVPYGLATGQTPGTPESGE